jgi:hypothetical protein
LEKVSQEVKDCMKMILFPEFKIFIYSLLLIVVPSAIYAQSDGALVEPKLVYGEKFTVKTEFASGIELDKTLFSKDEFSKTGNTLAIESDTMDKTHDGSWTILKLHNVKISISHTETEQKQLDVHQIQGDDSTKLNAIKSLPTSFLTSQYRDTFQSIGKIFEPEVKLGIEF